MVALRYLLDTNVLSEPLKPVPNAGVLAQLKRHSRTLATAAPVWHELIFGVARLPVSKRRAQIQEYLDTAVRGALLILSYNDLAAAWHGKERARLETLGKPPSFTDGQIAAIAVVNQLTLVTRNADDFLHFEGLRVEDWFTGPKKS